MTLKACMVARGLEKSLRPGLTALGSHSMKVKVTKPARATESIDLDKALAKTEGQSPRWDYGVGLAGSTTTRIAWIEVHPACSSDVRVILSKLAWLKKWLRRHGETDCLAKSSFHWIATASVCIDGKHRRRLNQAGMTMPKKSMELA
jgi:hypothetical protein